MLVVARTGIQILDYLAGVMINLFIHNRVIIQIHLIIVRRSDVTTINYDRELNLNQNKRMKINHIMLALILRRINLLSILTILFIFTFLTFSCKQNILKNEKKKYQNIRTIEFNTNIPERYIYLSEFTDKIEYVKLETNDSTLLKNIEKIRVVGNELFITDGESLFLFNRITGKYIRKIGKNGKGPGEFVEIEDFVVFPKSDLLFISDLKTGMLHKLDIKGRYIKDYKLPHAPFKVNKLSDELVSLYSYPDLLFNEMNSILISSLNLKTVNKLKNRSGTGITMKMYGKIPSTSRSRLEIFNDTLSYWEFEFDTLYRVMENEIIPAYTFNYPINTDSKISLSKPSDLIETSNYIFFLFGINSQMTELNHYVYNKKFNYLERLKFNFRKPQFQTKAGIG